MDDTSCLTVELGHKCIHVNGSGQLFLKCEYDKLGVALVGHGPATWMDNSGKCRKTVLTRRG